MSDEQRERPDSSEGDNDENALSTLESAARYVAASTAADGEDHGGRTSFAASFGALMHWGEAANLIRLESDFPFLQTKPTGQGDEHQGWFDERINRWHKATFPNRFGVAWGHNRSIVCN